MILGVHASIAVARRPDEVRATLDREGWPWLGRPGRFSTRVVRLEGRPARSFHLRIVSSRGVGRYGTTWRLRLERPDGPLTAEALLDLQLVIEPLKAGGTKLSIDGRAARELGKSVAPTSRAATRLAASGYARSLVEEIASVLEAQPTVGPATRHAKKDIGGDRPGVASDPRLSSRRRVTRTSGRIRRDTCPSACDHTIRWEARPMVLTPAPNFLFVLGLLVIGMACVTGIALVVYRILSRVFRV